MDTSHKIRAAMVDRKREHIRDLITNLIGDSCGGGRSRPGAWHTVGR